jgi:hypothetical protein
MAADPPPGSKPLRVEHIARSGSGSGPGAFMAPPKGVIFESRLSPEVAEWLSSMHRTARGVRIYASNSPTLIQMLDDCHRRISSLLERAGEIPLTVYDDRLMLGRDPVHVDPDRVNGIPFAFYRNAFRRFTFVQGLGKEELAQFLIALAAELARTNAAEEDLVSVLWRLRLPHVRYLTIDTLSMRSAREVSSQEEQVDMDRIRGDIEHILAAVYATAADSDDVVGGVTITKEDLVALEEIRQEAPEDLDMLDVATARSIAGLDPSDVTRIQRERARDLGSDGLARMFSVLLNVFWRQKTEPEALHSMQQYVELLDVLAVGQRWGELITGIEQLSESRVWCRDVHLSAVERALLLFADSARIVPLVSSLNQERWILSPNDLVHLLRTIGKPVVPALLESLEFLDNPTHRRMLCDLIGELGLPDRDTLLQRFLSTSRWFVARDILYMASKLPLQQLGLIAFKAIDHSHPKLRAAAIALLRGFGTGRVDQLIAERINDEDLEVRLTAVRTAAARRSADAIPVLEPILLSSDFEMRDPREIRVLASAYAAIAGAQAIPVLEKVLAPGLFNSLKNTESRRAAIIALSSIGTEPALDLIRKASRTINADVREAARRALAREPMSNDLEATTKLTGD